MKKRFIKLNINNGTVDEVENVTAEEDVTDEKGERSLSRGEKALIGVGIGTLLILGGAYVAHKRKNQENTDDSDQDIYEVEEDNGIVDPTAE